MGFSDTLDIALADAKGSWIAGGARRAVHPGHFIVRNAQVTAKGRMFGLIGAQIIFGQNRNGLKIIQRANIFRFHPGRIPFFTIKPGVGIGIFQLLLKLGQYNGLLPLLRIHGFNFDKPVWRIRLGVIAGVIDRRPFFHVQPPKFCDKSQLRLLGFQ